MDPEAAVMIFPGADAGCEDCVAAFENPLTRKAIYGAMDAYYAGSTSWRELRVWLWDLIHEPVILCPCCSDWESVADVIEQIEGYGRFWCCPMCELAGRGPTGVPR